LLWEREWRFGYPKHQIYTEPQNILYIILLKVQRVHGILFKIMPCYAVKCFFDASKYLVWLFLSTFLKSGKMGNFGAKMFWHQKTPLFSKIAYFSGFKTLYGVGCDLHDRVQIPAAKSRYRCCRGTAVERLDDRNPG